MNNRIKFAYHLHGWKFDPLKKTELKQKAQKILPEEYQSEMEGKHFLLTQRVVKLLVGCEVNRLKGRNI